MVPLERTGACTLPGGQSISPVASASLLPRASLCLTALGLSEATTNRDEGDRKLGTGDRKSRTHAGPKSGSTDKRSCASDRRGREGGWAPDRPDRSTASEARR